MDLSSYNSYQKQWNTRLDCIKIVAISLKLNLNMLVVLESDCSSVLANLLP